MFFNTLLENTAQGNPLGGSMGLIIMVLMFAVLYFVMIRPQKKQEKKDAEMRQNVAVGDEVSTIGGIIGKVVSINDETFVLETTKDKTKIRFLKGAVRSVDVKAADLAAQIMTNKENEAESANETKEAVEASKAEEAAPKKKSIFSKKK